MPEPKYGVIDCTGDKFIVADKDECDPNKWDVLCNLFRLDKKNTDRITIDARIEFYGIQYDPDQLKVLSKEEFIENFGQSLFDEASNMYDTSKQASYITLNNYKYIQGYIHNLNMLNIKYDEAVLRKAVLDNVIEVSY